MFPNFLKNVPNPMEMAMKAIENDPSKANDPRVKKYLELIRNGDSDKGIAEANNLLKEMGMSKEEGMKQVETFFNSHPMFSMFGRN